MSDIWAMAGMPSASVIALTLPASLPDDEFRELIEGIAEAARVTGAQVIGGNLSGGASLSVTTTAFGLPIAESVTRAGAEPGDAVYVTGTLGSAALGLAVLEADRFDLEYGSSFVERWKRPPTNGRAATVLAKVATAAVDVSDGCLQDLVHLCAASHVGAVVRADAIPTMTGYDATCRALGVNGLEMSLSGGEDYELLFTAPECDEAGSVATKIGEIRAGAGVRVLDDAGEEIDIGRSGYRHFS